MSSSADLAISQLRFDQLDLGRVADRAGAEVERGGVGQRVAVLVVGDVLRPGDDLDHDLVVGVDDAVRLVVDRAEIEDDPIVDPVDEVDVGGDSRIAGAKREPLRLAPIETTCALTTPSDAVGHRRQVVGQRHRAVALRAA